MNIVTRVLRSLDRWQRRNRVAAVAYAVARKFGDDDANLYVVALGWYGFMAIYPLLLVVITVFGYIGVGSLGRGVVDTLHQFPVIGAQFTPGSGGANLHGSAVALVVGILGLVYGAQGVTQTAEHAMARVWNLPRVRRPAFLPRLLRSLGGLGIVGAAFLANAFVDTFASSGGRFWLLRVVILVVMLFANAGFYLAAFWTLTPIVGPARRLLPGAITAAVAFTALTTIGTGLIQHQLRNSTDTYGAFASVIGVVTYLLLLAKITLYSAELNVVLARGLWPRALPTPADDSTGNDSTGNDSRSRTTASAEISISGPRRPVEPLRRS